MTVIYILTLKDMGNCFYLLISNSKKRKTIPVGYFLIILSHAKRMRVIRIKLYTYFFLIVNKMAR